MMNGKLGVVSLLIGVVAVLAPASARAKEGSTLQEMAGLRAQLVSVPVPDFADFDEAVLTQLEQARTDMEKAIAEPDAGPTRLAAAYGTLGQIYHAYELFGEARACYANATMLEPQNFVWLHLQADVSRQEGRFEDAATEFETAWALEPNDFAALVNLGGIYFDLNREEDAEAVFRRALALYPGSPSVMAGLGQLALRRQLYDDAISFFKTALVSVPEANRLHYSLAMAYRGAGKMEQAKEHLALRGTVGLRPPDPVLATLQPLREGERVHLIRGRLAFASERYEEAKNEFGLAVTADPTSARALINLGTTTAKLGDEEAAIDLFTRALAADADNAVAHFNLGSILAGRGLHTEALPHLIFSVDDQPHDAEAHLLLARSMVATDDIESSLPHFEQAAKIDQADDQAVIEGAAALVRLGLFFRAERVLSAGLERLPKSGGISYALGRLLAACPDENIRDGERALPLALAVQEAAPHPRHAQLVAQALAELGRCEDAASWQQFVVNAALKDGMDEIAEALKKDLDTYAAGPPCRPPVDASLTQ